MRYARSIGEQPNFQKIVLASVIMHVLFISLVVVPIKTRQGEFRSYQVTLVGPVQPRVANIEKSQASTATETVKSPPAEDVRMESFEKAAQEIARISAIKKLSKKIETKREKIRDIQISRQRAAGADLPSTGIQGRGTDTNTDPYYSLITQRIWKQWVYPDTNVTGLEVIVSVKIDKMGKVISQEVEKSSGNQLFDRSAIKAISKASPLPPPAEEMEIGVRFYP